MRPEHAPLRVMMVTERYLPDYGGTERQLALLARTLRARGVAVEVVTTRRLPALSRREVIDGIHVHRLRFPRIRGLATLGACINMMSFLLRRARRYDVIHVHTLGYLAGAATAMCRLLGKPVILKAVGWWELERGVLDPRREGRPMRGLLLKVLRRAQAWVAVSRALEAAMRQAGVPAPLIRYLPNGVDTARFRPSDRTAARERLGMEPNRPRVVFVGRLDPVKALPSLLSAWSTVVEKEPRALLDLVGDGDSQRELQTIAMTLGLDSSVLFHGRREDVLPYLQAADCFVLPSSNEGLSNTLLEAMAAGLAVVATRVSGSEDIVVSGRNGFLVSPKDHDDLSRQILAVLGDPGLARRLGITARKHVMEAFSIEQVAKNYQALYREARSS